MIHLLSHLEEEEEIDVDRIQDTLNLSLLVISLRRGETSWNNIAEDDFDSLCVLFGEGCS